MAVWQFVLDFVPASAASLSGVEAIRLTREQLDEIRLNFSANQVEKLFDGLSALLPEKQPWAPAMRIWGDEETDDVQAHSDEHGLECLQLRLDVRNLSLPLIGGMCALARRFGLLFATRDGGIVQPSREAIVREVLQSRAMRFVRVPEGFLREAARADLGPDLI